MHLSMSCTCLPVHTDRLRAPKQLCQACSCGNAGSPCRHLCQCLLTSPLPQVVGDAIKPHLQPLTASQLRLLEIYMDKARGQAA